MYFRCLLWCNFMLLYCIIHRSTQDQNEATSTVDEIRENQLFYDLERMKTVSPYDQNEATATVNEFKEKQLFEDLQQMKTASDVEKAEKLTRTITTRAMATRYDKRNWWEKAMEKSPTVPWTDRQTFFFSAPSKSLDALNKMNTTTRSTEFHFTKKKHNLPTQMLKSQSFLERLGNPTPWYGWGR